MRKRIMDAWRVLRGEYTAWPKVDPPGVWTWATTGHVTTSAVNGNFWVEPRAGSVKR